MLRNIDSIEADAGGSPSETLSQNKHRAGAMAQKLGALTALAEELSSVASIQMVVYSHLQFWFQKI